MDPKRYLGVRSWVMSGVVMALATALGVAALTHEQPVIGWIMIGFVALYIALRVFIVVVLVRAPAGAIPSPTRSAIRLETRVRAVTYIVVFGAIGSGMLVTSAIDHSILGDGGLVAGGAMIAFAIVFPFVTMRRARMRTAGATASDALPDDSGRRS